MLLSHQWADLVRPIVIVAHSVHSYGKLMISFLLHQHAQMLVWMYGKRKTYSVLMEMHTGEVTMKIDEWVARKARNRTRHGPAILPLAYTQIFLYPTTNIINHQFSML